MESLSSLIKRTIKEGAPLFNDGKQKECYEIYLETVKYACDIKKIQSSAIGGLLQAAANEAMQLVVDISEEKSYKKNQTTYSQAAWILRHCFDEILRIESQQEETLEVKRNSKESITKEEENEDENSSLGYWQDEKVSPQNDNEVAQCLVDIYHILQEVLPSIGQEKQIKYGRISYDDCIRGRDMIDTVTSLGLAPDQQMAIMKLSMLQQGGMILPVSHSKRTVSSRLIDITEDNVLEEFLGGEHLYRFGDSSTMDKAKEKLQGNSPHASSTRESILLIALSLASSGETIAKREEHDSKSSIESLLSREEKEQGVALGSYAHMLEKIVDLKDRKWGLRQTVYKNCFVGKEAISKIVESHGILSEDDRGSMSREEARQKLNQLLSCGLIYHVTKEHIVEDKVLFYSFASAGEIQDLLNGTNGIDESNRSMILQSLSRDDEILPLVRQVALEKQYQLFAKLDVNDILNSFYGCKSRDGWDTVDLQNWRNNMKRWGFGRRQDQDDDMVDKLAPVVSSIDPETWDKTGDPDWESPWGILAQIAIFDQVPRSAYRGTKDAFKWDQLAIRATKVAIEKRYFESAYKSTLNRFVVLLPLEHSESWDDQKLGVKLLLQMLSTVAIEDEDDGHSSYEIVKRLEFSKRLSTAFLEHAQVIAKFKRYPHRNRQHGRTTTLEERVWLASDLVPRWAKSQNEESKDGKVKKSIISLPVIPLKRFTRGR